MGALLALSGVLLQALFRNPLADPYRTRGLRRRCCRRAMRDARRLRGAHRAGQRRRRRACLGRPRYLLARGGGTARLLLTGVVVASACGALVSVLLALATSVQVRGMVFWLAGDLSWALSPRASLERRSSPRSCRGRGAPAERARGRGDARARRGSGSCRPGAASSSSPARILTAIAVVSAGTVGFVGLITPHAVRLIFKTSDHRLVAPASALAGGTVLAAADLIARTVASPRQLPVGAIMAIVGAPIFLSCCARGTATRIEASARWRRPLPPGCAPRSWRDTAPHRRRRSGGRPGACGHGSPLSALPPPPRWRAQSIPRHREPG